MSKSADLFPAFHKALHAWYRRHGRTTLPWRNTGDPYAIYISEIMLQQTQVKTVLGRFYQPFLKRFPTLGALAGASEKEVLKLWQGLGYYNRASNLHRAARACKAGLPDDIDALLALPGIGRNTAHAIAAFAYHAPVPVMEANVKRVLSRIFALRAPKEKELWEKAAALLDRKNPFDYNQAMMDLGSAVCTRRKPGCSHCPANMLCKGKASPESYPAAKAKKAVPVRRKTIVVLHNGKGQYYATPRTGKFLRGLYHFNEGKRLRGDRHLGDIRQQYSHFTLEAGIYLRHAKAAQGKGWHTLHRLEKLPMSMAEQKILKLL